MEGAASHQLVGQQGSSYFLSIRCSVKVTVPQNRWPFRRTGMRRSSAYQIQILPLPLSTPEGTSGWTRMVLNVPAGVFICSRTSACTSTVTVLEPSFSGKEKVLPGCNGSEPTT